MTRILENLPNNTLLRRLHLVRVTERVEKEKKSTNFLLHIAKSQLTELHLQNLQVNPQDFNSFVKHIADSREVRPLFQLREFVLEKMSLTREVSFNLKYFGKLLKMVLLVLITDSSWQVTYYKYPRHGM